jgi:hypothetical protein
VKASGSQWRPDMAGNQCSGVVVMSYGTPVCKDVNTKAEEATVLGAVTRQ